MNRAVSWGRSNISVAIKKNQQLNNAEKKKNSSFFELALSEGATHGVRRGSRGARKEEATLQFEDARASFDVWNTGW